MVQKALKWLDAEKIGYAFHNYKETGIDKNTIELWLQHFPVNKLINTQSTTYRELPAEEKACITNKADAIELMVKYTSIIKRPVWDFGNGKFFLGWKEQEIKELLE